MAIVQTELYLHWTDVPVINIAAECDICQLCLGEGPDLC